MAFAGILPLITLTYLTINAAVINNKFVATKVYDQTFIKAPFASSPSDIQWGNGYNSLKLQPTFNAAVTVRSLDEKPYKRIQIQLKACRTGGETFSFLSGELFTAGAFLSATSPSLNEYFKTSQITELSTVLVIKIDVTTNASEVNEFTFTKRAEHLLKNEDYKDFVEFYGTHCLSRVIYGGYLYITMEFSLITRKEKETLDHHLAQLQERYDTVSQLKDALRKLNQRKASQINVFTVGSERPPPRPDISGVLTFAEEFMQSIETLETSRVHHIEYHSMFQIYYASTFGFRHYALPIQEKVDEIVQISAAFEDVKSQTNSILELKEKDETFSFLSANAADLVKDIVNEATTLQIDLKTKFRYSHATELQSLIEKYKKDPYRAQNALSNLLKNEKYFDTSKTCYLRSRGLSRYVSIDKNNYPRLTDTSPIRLKFTHLDTLSDKRVAYYQQYFLITSETTPNNYLCMGKNNWYVFWDHHLSVDIRKCSWYLSPASSLINPGSFVGFSDILLIHNRYWPGYVIGTTDDGLWLQTVTKEVAEIQARHQWIIEKTPF